MGQTKRFQPELLCAFVWIAGAALLPTPAEAATVHSSIKANFCLEMPGGGEAVPGRQLQVSGCDGGASQEFSYSPTGGFHFGSLCVSAASGRGKDGEPVTLSSCDGSLRQQWNLTGAGEFRGIDGKCMDITGGIAVSGAKVILWPCRGATNQKWSLQGSSTFTQPVLPAQTETGREPNDACSVAQIRPSSTGGLSIVSPDGSKYLINKEDAKGIAQIYVGQTGSANPVCITCTERPNGPKPGKFKMQPHWHPSGRWIVIAAEQEKHDKPWYMTKGIVEGLLQSGIWVDMYAVSPDGNDWHRLEEFGPSSPSRANGFTGVAFTPDGRTGVWAQIMDGNVFAHTFGVWQLIAADFRELNGVPTMMNLRNITPPDTFWAEPGNFSPNGRDLVLTADTGFPDHSKVMGQDQYVLDIFSGRIRNLTRTPDLWDEHGVFSPDGEKLLFMSSYPYRADPKASKTLSLKTEFMMMNKDGSDLRQVTHFNVPGYSESLAKGSVAANGEWAPDGRSISVLNLFFPKYRSWDIVFRGTCGLR